jgi:hypothetical protein
MHNPNLMAQDAMNPVGQFRMMMAGMWGGKGMTKDDFDVLKARHGEHNVDQGGFIHKGRTGSPLDSQKLKDMIWKPGQSQFMVETKPVVNVNVKIGDRELKDITTEAIVQNDAFQNE